MKRFLAFAAVVLGISGCAVVPLGPPILVGHRPVYIGPPVPRIVYPGHGYRHGYYGRGYRHRGHHGDY